MWSQTNNLVSTSTSIHSSLLCVCGLISSTCFLFCLSSSFIFPRVALFLSSPLFNSLFSPCCFVSSLLFLFPRPHFPSLLFPSISLSSLPLSPPFFHLFLLSSSSSSPLPLRLRAASSWSISKLRAPDTTDTIHRAGAEGESQTVTTSNQQH